MKIALISYQDEGKYVSSTENEDAILLQFLTSKGLNITTEIWTDQQVFWENYNLAILKSPWDYFDRIAEFYRWLERMQALKVPLLNPVHVVKWNCDKHYLKDIQASGLIVTPTIFLEKGTKPDLIEYFKQFRTEQIIVKPCISGGSKNTFKVNIADLPHLIPKLHILLCEEAFIVQPFLKEIETKGEWSFLFFNGKFSHSLLKKAKVDDFRVQHYLGGTIHPEPPPVHLLQSARKYVDQFAKGCLYARVDGLEINGNFMLMELELIEPFLFLQTEPDSYENYFEALTALMPVS